MGGLPRNVMPLTRVLLEVKHVVSITAFQTIQSFGARHGPTIRHPELLASWNEGNIDQKSDFLKPCGLSEAIEEDSGSDAYIINYCSHFAFIVNGVARATTRNSAGGRRGIRDKSQAYAAMLSGGIPAP